MTHHSLYMFNISMIEVAHLIKCVYQLLIEVLATWLYLTHQERARLAVHIGLQSRTILTLEYKHGKHSQVNL